MVHKLGWTSESQETFLKYRFLGFTLRDKNLLSVGRAGSLFLTRQSINHWSSSWHLGITALEQHKIIQVLLYMTVLPICLKKKKSHLHYLLFSRLKIPNFLSSFNRSWSDMVSKPFNSLVAFLWMYSSLIYLQ